MRSVCRPAPTRTPLAVHPRPPTPCRRASQVRPEPMPGQWTSPTHSSCSPSTRRQSSWPDRPTGASTSNLRAARAGVVIGIDRVPELRTVEEHDDVVVIGAGLTLSEIERRLGGRVPLLAELLPQFASRLIRNGATLGGNLATASPIGDAAPVLLALEASLVLASQAGERIVPIDEFFTGYRRTVRRHDEIIRAVRIPLPLCPITDFHKISKRRFDDISGVAVACALDVHDGVVAKARIGIGGVAATPLRAFATEQVLEGRPWSESTVRDAAAVLREEGTPIDDHRASAAYRRAMLATALLRLHADHERAGSTAGARA